MDSYKVIKKAPVYAYTNGEIAVDYPNTFVDAGKTVSGEKETIFVSTEDGSQDENFIKLGNNKYIKATAVTKNSNVYSKVEGDSSNNQNQQKMATSATPTAPTTGMAKSHKVLIGAVVGAGLGATYGHFKGKKYIWPTVIGAALGVGASMLIHHMNSSSVAPIATPVAPATPAPSSEFAGMNASGDMKKKKPVKGHRDAMGNWVSGHF
jgi:hypothetical protein